MASGNFVILSQKVTISVQAAQAHFYQVFTFLKVWMIKWKIVSALYYGAFLLESPVIGCGLHQYIIFLFFSSGLSFFLFYIWVVVTNENMIEILFLFSYLTVGWQAVTGNDKILHLINSFKTDIFTDQLEQLTISLSNRNILTKNIICSVRHC